MGVEKINGYFSIGGKRIDIQGAKYWYGDAEIAKKIGFVKQTDRKADDTAASVSSRPNPYDKELLIQLTAVMKPEGALGVGNSSQRDKTRRFTFYCDPAFGEEAITKLPGSTMDANLLPGSWKVDRVYRKLQITRR